MKKLIYLSLILILFGCTTKTPTKTSICLQACQAALESNQNLESGPCLLDPEPTDKNWVCDVAHNPRQQVDNLPENQCQSYRAGQAKHFVEVTPDCKVIKTN